jgi:CcmD family protein
MRKRITWLIVLLAASLPARLLAAENWLNETMYSSGKINVVVGVVAVVLAGIFLYLILLDRRLRRLEEENQRAE